MYQHYFMNIMLINCTIEPDNSSIFQYQWIICLYYMDKIDNISTMYKREKIN